MVKAMKAKSQSRKRPRAWITWKWPHVFFFFLDTNNIRRWEIQAQDHNSEMLRLQAHINHLSYKIVAKMMKLFFCWEKRWGVDCACLCSWEECEATTRRAIGGGALMRSHVLVIFPSVWILNISCFFQAPKPQSLKNV